MRSCVPVICTTHTLSKSLRRRRRPESASQNSPRATPHDAYSTIAATPSRGHRHTKLTTRQYNAGQGRQKTTFKSNVVRNLKKDIARMMPFLEAKQASGSPNVALREQAKGRRARKEKVEA